MGTETNLVLVNIETGIAFDGDEFAFVVNADTLSDVDRDALNLADDTAWYSDYACKIVRRVGVPVAELWAAYKREQQPTAIEPNEITAERQGQYSDGTWDYSVTFVFDYATITVGVEYGGEIDDDDDETVPDDVAESAARILADHYGIIVAVES